MTIGYQKERWSDVVDEEDTYYSYLPKQTSGPDKDGKKKTIEYYFNDHGKKVMKTTTTKVTKLANTRISKSAVERRKTWVKFGDAVNDNVGDNLTVVSREVIAFERPNAPGTNAEDSNASSDPLASNSGILMHCRSCGKKGEHWTAKCPLKDLAQPSETFVDNSTHPSPTSEPGAPKGAYVPPTKRDRALRPAPGADMRRRNDENSVRVNNLSEDTSEADLNELFSPFGSVSRVHVVMDHKTGMSRGFGFVNFVRREDGERAIAKLNGYGYDNLILRVEWAPPRAN
ncbi:Eukaryotic translation initiation factor 3 subunit G, N-terminal [Artemisia annua]|uniref:Eukaryotic translation initiation factor 3 subunit G n=1 Tax=Artemisia annua TaxID=35608 RepID=A0A2U1N4B5_ARTAN|nr:Eukaryotic translation initiation factor 3 subunit G, N-terminal [Artemisia annua]